MPVVDGFDMPQPEAWIVDQDRLADVGKLLLRVTAAGLALYGRAERYERRMLTFGLVPPLEPSVARQLVVTCTKVHSGQAGAEQFQFNRHDLGASMFQTGVYTVTLGGPFPKRQGAQPVKVPDVEEFSTDLYADGLIAWNTLTAVMLGGIVVPTLQAKDVLVSPMAPRDPLGGYAAWVTTVSVQL